jgi:hypothetical protein
MFDEFSAEGFQRAAQYLSELEVLSIIPPAEGGNAWADAVAKVVSSSPHFDLANGQAKHGAAEAPHRDATYEDHAIPRAQRKRARCPADRLSLGRSNA